MTVSALLEGEILLDTGPVVAIMSASDRHHEACVQQLRHIRGSLLTCWPVVTEAAWLLRGYPEALKLLLGSFDRGSFELASLDKQDLPAIATILARYRDLGVQLADAALVHIGNRERIETIFTLDRRDFNVLRLAHGKRFRIIP